MQPFQESLKIRIMLMENPSLRYVDTGRYRRDHHSVRSSVQQQFSDVCAQLAPGIDSIPNIDDWHKNALYDIFASEVVTGMRNTIGDYVWDQLRPHRHNIPVADLVQPARTVPEINAYVTSFSNTSNLLKHIFATELQHLFSAGRLEVLDLQLYDGGKTEDIQVSEIISKIVARAAIRDCDHVSSAAVEGIFDTAFTELFYALRNKGLRFSVSVDSHHQTAIRTKNIPKEDVLERLQKKAQNIKPRGEITPRNKEYMYLLLSLMLSLGFFSSSLAFNWARRNNWLERVFDSVGVFGLSNSIALALFSRNADLISMLVILLGRKRFLASYAELLEYLRVPEEELKPALTFSNVHVPCLSSRATPYAAEQHGGIFMTESGLSTTAQNCSIIIGNKTALLYTGNRMKYFDVFASPRGSHLSEAGDASYRIVAVGDNFEVVGV